MTHCEINCKAEIPPFLPGSCFSPQVLAPGMHSSSLPFHEWITRLRSGELLGQAICIQISAFKELHGPEQTLPLRFGFLISKMGIIVVKN
jgi:hypothetical protein